MALGNIKVKRTNVIARIEKVRDKAQKVADAAPDKIENAEATLKEARAAQTELTATLVSEGVVAESSARYAYKNGAYGVNGLSVEVSLNKSQCRRLNSAEDAVSKAQNAVYEAQNEEHQAQHRLNEANRDLALLNASEEETINVKTAGFLGYFE